MDRSVQRGSVGKAGACVGSRCRTSYGGIRRCLGFGRKRQGLGGQAEPALAGGCGSQVLASIAVTSPLVSGVICALRVAVADA